jgi:3-oxoacyl-(acyl-carrier-protein) synthase
MSDTKLVITGISSISALGVEYDTLSAGLARKPELGSVREFEFHQFEKDIPCYRIKDFEPKEILGKKGLRTKDLATKVLLATMELGFKERFENEELDTKPGIVVGTAFGSVQSIGDFLSDSIVNGVNAVNPMLFANTVINSPTGNANIRYGVKTLSTTVSTAFNSGIDALIYTCDYIRSGYLPAIVAGGLEEISYYTLLGLDRSGALSKSGNMKPFAKDADGIVMGEGCAMFLIETDDSAQVHGVNGIIEIAGYSNAFDPADGQIGFNPQGEGARYTVEQALAMANIDAGAIDFIVSGANGTPDGDTMESLVVRDIFGDTPVTAYKAKTGECYGASAALSTACAISDMKNNRITGIEDSYDTANDINLVSGTIESKESEYALVTSYSCDGNCSTIILKNLK